MFGFLLNAYSFAPVHPLAVLRTLVLGLLFAAALTVVLGVLVRHRLAGGFGAAVLIGVLLGWGRANSMLASYLRQGLPLKIVLGLVAVAVLVAGVWLFWRFVRRPGGWPRVTYALNVVGVLFVAGGLFCAFRSAPAPPPPPPAPPAAPPRHDVIERIYDWDNSAFLDALTQRGFAIGTANSSNYLIKIGRASCRGRGEIVGVAGSLK